MSKRNSNADGIPELELEQSRAVTRFNNFLLLKGYSASTARTYLYVLRRFFRYHERLPVELQRSDIEPYLQRRLHDGTNSNILQTERSALHQYFNAR